MSITQRIIRKLKATIISEYEFRKGLDTIKFYCRKIDLENKILNYTEMGVVPAQPGCKQIIVSLTTHGKRLWDVCFAIESLMQQTVKPNRIVLWLDEKLKDSPLPLALVKQSARGLEIRYTRDLKPYTKLIPALKEFPEDVIITVDDDMAYDFDVIEKLTNAYKAEPDCIHACLLKAMTFDKNGQLTGYNSWKNSTSTRGQHLIMGVGGVLYPPHTLSSEVMNEEVFTSICPTADDVWFTAMALLNNTPINKVVTRDFNGNEFVYNDSVQDTGLWFINRDGANDNQIKAVYSRYGIYDLIKKQ